MRAMDTFMIMSMAMKGMPMPTALKTMFTAAMKSTAKKAMTMKSTSIAMNIVPIIMPTPA